VVLETTRLVEGTVAQVRWTDAGSGRVVEIAEDRIGLSLRAPGESQTFEVVAETVRLETGAEAALCAELAVEASNRPEFGPVDCLE
jgi:hypothetical protein